MTIINCAFIDRYKLDDPELLSLKNVNDKFYELMGSGLISEYLPILRPIDAHVINEMKDVMAKFRSILLEKLKQHKDIYTPGIMRDFTDFVIQAKEEAIKDDLAIAKHLTDYNLMMIVNDLFAAGTDTSQTTLRWAILALINYPAIQEKVHNEIAENIGERMPTHEDMKVLPYTNAFLKEVLRFWPAAPIGLEHFTTVDTELGGFKVPKKTSVYFNLYAINHDPKYWKNPDVFDPTHFLDSNGQLITGRIESFVTFGIGSRACIGEKLAYVNAFLIIVRMLQTLHFQFPEGKTSSDLSPLNIVLVLLPKDTPIVVKRRK